MCRFFKTSRSGCYVKRMDISAKDLPLAEKDEGMSGEVQ